MGEIVKSEEKEENGIIPIVYYEMMRLKLEGYTYKEIAKKTGYDDGYIAKLFAKSGQLNSFFETYKSEELDFRKKTAQQTFEANIDKIARKPVTVAVNSDNDTSAINACKEVLDRVFGKNKERMDVTGVLGVFNMSDFVKKIDGQEQRDIIEVETKPD